MNITLRDAVLYGSILLALGAGQARSEMHAAQQDKRADAQDRAIADMRAENRETSHTIQTMALALQKQADALDAMQNPQRTGPVRPVR